MYTIGELSHISRVSIRALRHYDRIGLLLPAQTTDAGYRLYDEAALKRLYLILLYKELEFPLANIRKILDDPDFDSMHALDTQIQLLTMKREHITNLIVLAKAIKLKGLNNMNVTADTFSAFDSRKLDDYANQAKAAWGKTEAYQEFEQKNAKRSKSDQQQLGQDMMNLIGSFGQYRHLDPAGPEGQTAVQQLRDFITCNYYDCKVPILRGLADMYDCGGDFTQNIDKAGGQGTAAFLAQAMRIYCTQHAK